ncbi:hypothetical protein ACNKHO_12935 [Shigella flexneri]
MDQPELSGPWRTALADHQSVFARYISSLKDHALRRGVLCEPQAKLAGDQASSLRKCVARCIWAKSFSYAQGFSQLRAASDEYNCDKNYGEIAKISAQAASLVAVPSENHECLR